MGAGGGRRRRKRRELAAPHRPLLLVGQVAGRRHAAAARERDGRAVGKSTAGRRKRDWLGFVGLLGYAAGPDHRATAP
nr:unnamed protein product [Digitaria exilis]